MQNHSHEKVTLALLDVELPPLLAQVYSKCMRKSVRVQLDWAREAKDQVGCRVAKSCVMLAQGKGQSKATNQKTNTKQKALSSQARTFAGRMHGKPVQNSGKFMHMVHSVGSRQTHAGSTD